MVDNNPRALEPLIVFTGELAPIPMDLFRLVTPRRFGAALWLCSIGVARGAPIAFDVPAQPAASAIVAFAKQASVEVLFSYRDLAAVRSTAVVGTFEPDAALARLLEGTGFVFTRNASGKYVVVPAAKRVATIRGTIVGEADGAPVMGARVRLDGANFAIETGGNGRFELGDLPTGPQVLVVQAEGFRTLRVTGIDTPAGQRLDLGAIRLVRGADDPQRLEDLVVNAAEFGPDSDLVALQAVIVTPSRFALAEERGPVTATLTESDLVALPQLGEDLYRAISHLPGLAADDFTAKFWVRGAPHEQLLARLDGVDLIEPFHLKDVDGTLSILDLGTIARMDLYTGGFTAEYGDRLAGVLTMETDRYVRADAQTTIGVSLTGIAAASRGSGEHGRSRWLLGARTGYPALALEITNGSNTIKPRYYDISAKWEYDITPQQTVSLHALHAHDTMEFRDGDGPILHSRYGSDYVWLRWQGELGPRLQTEGVLAATWLQASRTGTGAFDHFYPLHLTDDRTAQWLTWRQEATVKLTDRALWRGGIEAKTGTADYDYHSRYDFGALVDAALVTREAVRDEQVKARGDTLGGFTSLRFAPVRPLAVEAGVRYDADNYAHDAELTPRLNLAYTHHRTTWRAAWGQYSQAQGLHQLSIGDSETSFHRAERAEHRVVSVEQRFSAGINLRLEGYDRLTRHPRPHWENVVYTNDVVPELRFDRIRLDPVSQRARGIELIAEQRANPRFTWSASYAWARSQETLANGAVIPRPRDQRHTLYLDATYTPNPRWQFSLAWQYHTGWPATPQTFTATPLADGSIAIFGQPGSLYSSRLPDYHRLDLRVQRRLRLPHGDVRLYLDVFNAYARRNSIGYRYDLTVQSDASFTVVRHDDHNLFPMLPSVGAVWDF